jgi:hypothetical protein
LTDQNTLEFDVFIKSNSGSFELTSYQCAFKFHRAIKNGGSLVFSYISGSSQLNNLPNIGVGIKNDNGIEELAFASMPGGDVITGTPVKIGRFKLQNTYPFGIYAHKILNLTWDFNGVISTILTGTGFSNITTPANHISNIESFQQLNIIQAVGSDTSDINQHPGKTIDGKGFYDNDPDSKWISQPMTKWLIYNLGSNKIVNLLRFSFYKFEQGRKYYYSVQVSDNMVDWEEIVTNDTSDLIEWTDKLVNPVSAQYVKLIMNGNNQDQWAILWETEIWAGDQTVPVELNSFTGFSDGANVILNWTTASEINNLGFEIQRRELQGNNTPMNQWNVIGFVNGNETTTENHNYSFKDQNIRPGRFYYRLKQIDYDGSPTYSDEIEIVVLNIIGEYQLFQNYPNPFNPETKIRFNLPQEGKVKLTVFNIIGEQVAELINEEMPQGAHEISFNGVNLASGIYLYRLDIENGFSDIRKMVLLK